MYFLIGLGVIVVLVYGNMLYDHIKEKKKADEQTDMTEKMQTKAGDAQTESVKADDGELIAMDREDNIYVIETVQRPEYEELYLQVLDDMTAQRKRIQKNAADRKVYAIVCVTTLSETLKLAAEKENSIRIFSYELNFRNIM